MYIPNKELDEDDYCELCERYTESISRIENSKEIWICEDCGTKKSD